MEIWMSVNEHNQSVNNGVNTDQADMWDLPFGTSIILPRLEREATLVAIHTSTLEQVRNIQLVFFCKYKFIMQFFQTSF